MNTNTFKASDPFKPSWPNAALPILWKSSVPIIDFIPSVMVEAKVDLEKTLVDSGIGGDVKPSRLIAPELIYVVEAADEIEAKYAKVTMAKEIIIFVQFILALLLPLRSKLQWIFIFYILLLTTNMFLSSTMIWPTHID